MPWDAINLMTSHQPKLEDLKRCTGHQAEFAVRIWETILHSTHKSEFEVHLHFMLQVSQK